MNSMIQSLLWKEWHEQRWRLAFGCVMMAALPATGLMVRMVPDWAVVVVTMLVGGLLLPIFATMGLIAPERADRTLGSLLILPVSSRAVVAIKLAVGLVTCLVPLACAGMVILLVAGGRELPASRLLAMCSGSALLAGVLLVWTLAFSVGQPTEARVGLVGLGVIAAWVMLTMVMNMVWVLGRRDLVELPIVKAISPSLVLDDAFHGRWPSGHFMLIQGLCAVCLLMWAQRCVRVQGRERS
jgi:hypothetical protein